LYLLIAQYAVDLIPRLILPLKPPNISDMVLFYVMCVA